jgi:hypothetical protein
VAKIPPADSKPEDADATAYVSAQRGAPLPSEFQEDTVVNVKPRKSNPLAPVEIGETGQATRVFPVEDTTIVISDSTGEPPEVTTVTRTNTKSAKKAVKEVGERSHLNEATTVASKAQVTGPAPAVPSPSLTGKVSEPSIEEIDRTAFQEKIKPFDPISGNEQLREQVIREVVTTSSTTKRKTGIVNDPNLKMKTARTSEQAWKKNQQRARQTKIVFGFLVIAMAALGATAAYLLATLPG